LPIFQKSQLFGGIDQDVGVRADAKPSAFVEETAGRENPVTEIGFRNRTKPCHGTMRDHAIDLGIGDMRGVDKAPVLIDGQPIEQQFDGTLAAPGDAVLDLLGLLGDVNMYRPVGGQRQDRRDLLWRGGPQTMRRDPHDGVRQGGHGPPAGLDQPTVPLDVVDEPALTGRGRLSAETGMGVEDRKEGERDARCRRGRGDPRREFGDIAVGRTAGVVVDVVKLADAREPAFEHLQESLGRNGLDIVGFHVVDEAVHRLAPGPEAVLASIKAGAALLGETRHAALEGMAVQVGQTGQADLVALVVRLCRRAACNGLDTAVGQGEPHIVGPALGQQQRMEPQAGSGHVIMYSHNNGTMQCDRLWKNARLATLEGEGLGLVEGGLIAAREGRIVYAGPAAGAPSFEAAETVDCEGRWITPGLVDCHTHIVYGGNRAHEFELRLAGASYEEIARAGGGIVSTMRATRQASEDDLVQSALPRVDALLREGVTTLEIKSGYGLDLAAEEKSLRAARRIGELRSVAVTTTFLGAHALPPEANGDKDAYIAKVCDEMLPAVARAGLADAVDGFCEGIAFTPEQIGRVFEVAKAHGLRVKLHAEQLSNLGGAKLAARYNALSADHLEHVDEAGVTAMAQAGVVAVLLPGAFYFVRETHKPPLELLRRHGVKLAIASDSNPGTSPLTSLLLAMNMAATLFRLTVDECLAGVTREAARALGRLDTVGTLEPGKWCDLAIWDIERPAELVYRMGFNPLHARVWRGR
jgi:imidazolonepropionase